MQLPGRGGPDRERGAGSSYLWLPHCRAMSGGVCLSTPHTSSPAPFLRGPRPSPAPAWEQPLVTAFTWWLSSPRPCLRNNRYLMPPRAFSSEGPAGGAFLPAMLDRGCPPSPHQSGVSLIRSISSYLSAENSLCLAERLPAAGDVESLPCICSYRLPVSPNPESSCLTLTCTHSSYTQDRNPAPV